MYVCNMYIHDLDMVYIHVCVGVIMRYMYMWEASCWWFVSLWAELLQ